MHKFKKITPARNSKCFGDSSAHHQEFIHRTIGTGIWQTTFEQDQDGTEFHPGSSRKLSSNIYDM